jgi:hypothetical protein
MDYRSRTGFSPLAGIGLIVTRMNYVRKVRETYRFSPLAGIGLIVTGTDGNARFAWDSGEYGFQSPCGDWVNCDGFCYLYPHPRCIHCFSPLAPKERGQAGIGFIATALIA